MIWPTFLGGIQIPGKNKHVLHVSRWVVSSPCTIRVEHKPSYVEMIQPCHLNHVEWPPGQQPMVFYHYYLCIFCANVQNILWVIPSNHVALYSGFELSQVSISEFC